jgi:pimeloyl-ACP methyl ester carboxylesterase
MPVLAARVGLATGSTRMLHVDGDGPAIILLHGYADSAASWTGVLDHLARLGHRAVAIDLPGFGAAAARPPGPMVPVLDDALRSLIGELDEGPAVVVGNSLGCVVALRAATALPTQIAGVATFSEPTHGFTRVQRMVSARHESWLIRLATRQRRMTTSIGPFLLVRVGARVLYSRKGIDHAHLRGIADYIYAGGEPWQAMREVRELALGAAGFYDLAAVRCPALIAHGDRDRIIPISSSRRIAAAIAQSEIVVLDHLGHCPHVEAPEQIAALLSGFVQRRCSSDEGKAVHGTQDR